MNCPACAVELKMSERSGVEIDYCPKCRGVWLDRGELDKIIERSEAQVDETPPQRPQSEPYRPEYHDRYYDKDYYKKKKKKSFLGDLLDF